MFSLKKLIFILKNGLNNPRFYIDSININWKTILLLPLLLTLLMAFNYTKILLPQLSATQEAVNASLPYLPEFSLKDRQLQLSPNEKPLYFKSNELQLIIDDQVTNLSEEGLVLSSPRQQAIDLSSRFNLLIIKNQIVFYHLDVDQLLFFSNVTIENDDQLSTMLSQISTHHFSIVSLVYLIAWLIALLSISYFILITAVLAGFLNVRLNFPLPLFIRVKLVIVCAFTPLLLIELIRLIFPQFSVLLFFQIAIVLYTIYIAFKQHTQFMHKLLSHIELVEKEEKREDE